MTVTIYHNRRCSKSRQTLDLLDAKGVKPRIVEYLKTPPLAAELKTILKALGLKPCDLMRTSEPRYTELGLKDRDLDGREDPRDTLTRSSSAQRNRRKLKCSGCGNWRRPDRRLGCRRPI